jgi:imidazolonepropionase-like amidohydrolase
VIRYDPRLTERLLQAGTYISFTLQAGGWDSILRLRAKRAAEGLTAAEARQLDQLERHYDAKLELFQRLVRDGALPRLVVSSDAGPFDVSFGHLHYGLELAVQAGLAPREALQTATKTAAEACGVSDLVGTLEPGKEADVLVVRGDPLEAIGALANVVAVFKGGARVV